MLFAPLIFLSYELSKRRVLPKDFYNFGKGFVVYLVNMLVLYFFRRVLYLHYQPFALFLYVFILHYLIPQIILIFFFFLLVRRDFYYQRDKNEWVSDFVVFSIGFYLFDSIVHFLMEYNRHDPFILFAFPVIRLLVIAITAFLLVLINYRELKFWLIAIFVYLFAFVFLALPEVLYDLSYFLPSFVFAGVLFVLGVGVFILKGEKV